jgi:hypothetical protein
MARRATIGAIASVQRPATAPGRQELRNARLELAGASGGEHEYRNAVMARTATWARRAQATHRRELGSGHRLVVAAAGTGPEQLVAPPVESVPSSPARLRVGRERPAESRPPGPPPSAAGDAPACDPLLSAGRATKERSPARRSANARVAGPAALAPPDRRPASRPHGRPRAAATSPPRRPPPPGSPRRRRGVPTALLGRDSPSFRELPVRRTR